MAERPAHLSHLEHLGDATKFSPQIHALIPRCDLLENFSPAEVRLLARPPAPRSSAKARAAISC